MNQTISETVYRFHMLYPYRLEIGFDSGWKSASYASNPLESCIEAICDYLLGLPQS